MSESKLPESGLKWIKTLNETAKTNENKDVMAIAFQLLSFQQVNTLLGKTFSNLGVPEMSELIQLEDTTFPNPPEEFSNWYVSSRDNQAGRLVADAVFAITADSETNASEV